MKGTIGAIVETFVGLAVALFLFANLDTTYWDGFQTFVFIVGITFVVTMALACFFDSRKKK